MEQGEYTPQRKTGTFDGIPFHVTPEGKVELVGYDRHNPRHERALRMLQALHPLAPRTALEQVLITSLDSDITMSPTPFKRWANFEPRESTIAEDSDASPTPAKWWQRHQAAAGPTSEGNERSSMRQSSESSSTPGLSYGGPSPDMSSQRSRSATESPLNQPFGSPGEQGGGMQPAYPSSGTPGSGEPKRRFKFGKSPSKTPPRPPAIPEVPAASPAGGRGSRAAEYAPRSSTTASSSVTQRMLSAAHTLSQAPISKDVSKTLGQRYLAAVGEVLPDSPASYRSPMAASTPPRDASPLPGTSSPSAWLQSIPPTPTSAATPSGPGPSRFQAGAGTPTSGTIR